MTKRSTTRLSAGAALITGIGMMGIVTAVPAQAATSLQYECSTPDASQTFDFTLDTAAPETATVGDEVTITPSGTVTLGSELTEALRTEGAEYLEGTLPGVEATISNGTDSVAVPTDITMPRTSISTDPATLPLNGASQTATVSQAGEYTISAPDSFSATVSAFDADEDLVGQAFDLDCTYVEGSGDQVISTVTVSEDTPGDDDGPGDGDGPGDEEPAPEVDDWFDEPASLPLVGNVFTVEGDATRDGTLSVEVLAGTQGDDGESAPGDVLTTYTWDLTEGANSKDFNLVEGADYVRLVSQDCIDEAGNDESVAGGCNVTYRAPWADDGTNDDDGEPVYEPTGGDTGEQPPAQPEVPQVVQTDGFQPAAAPQQDDTLVYALGGLLLVGAGTVLVARRRAVSRR